MHAYGLLTFCTGHFARFLKFDPITFIENVRFMNTRHISSGIYQRSSTEKSDLKIRMENLDYLWESPERKESEMEVMTPTGTLSSAEVELRGNWERNRRICQENDQAGYNFRLWVRVY